MSFTSNRVLFGVIGISLGVSFAIVLGRDGVDSNPRAVDTAAGDLAAQEMTEAAAGAVGTLRGEGASVLPTMKVYKSPTCGCCSGWVEHVRAAGFPVDTEDIHHVLEINRREGVPLDLQSCHTALVDGYVIEGHVPADVIQRLLRERPAIAGLAAPGMPVGSPGMEGPNAQPYEIVAFARDGQRAVYETR